MTLVDRETRCFLSIRAVRLRSQEIGQQMVNDAPVAVLQRSVSIVR